MKIDMEKIRARESDPALIVHAQKKSDQITTRLSLHRIKLLGVLAQRLPEPINKINTLRVLAGDMQSATKDLVPCSRGCSACCSMDTLISVEEADVIAQEIGIVAAVPAQFFDGQRVLKYEGVPCTFLKNNQCSIYISRPFACRIHITVAPDNVLCEIIPGQKNMLPRFDTIAFDMIYSMVLVIH